VKVLVCGGRDYADAGFLYGFLDTLKPSVVVHGCAPGADSLAGRWATERGVPQEPYPADWQKYGRRAGPLRNEQMLREAKPDLVVAFPGGRGTAHMVRIAEEAGVKVIHAEDGIEPRAR
jgi:hypothetical protein